MFEIGVGTLSLFFGWLCFDHASKVRALYSTGRPPLSRYYGGKPLMLFPFALGTLFVLDGLALLALAAHERLRAAGGLENLVSLEMLSILAVVLISAAALIRVATAESRNERDAGRQKFRSGSGADMSLAGK